MTKVLISLRDAILSDVVKTAFKNFPTMATYPVPRSRVVGLAAEDDVDAVVIDIEKGEEHEGGLIDRLRDKAPDVELVVLAEPSLRERMNRLKLSHGIFTVVPLPLDAFDIAKRIVRLEALLADRGRQIG
ncbi:MAG: hypothetical protein H6807_07400 [Planctomycetes bacterium]|nr:hypothetical protein [Planctomycetota bacterium]